MKFLLHVLSALTLPLAAQGQGIYVTPNGVGVNTGSPTAKWEVVAGNLGTSVGNNLAIATFSAYSANYDQLTVKSARVAGGVSWDSAALILQRRVDVSDMGFVKFVDWDVALGSGGAEALRVKNNGNVGVGTRAPTSLLHLQKAAQQIEWSLQLANPTNISATGYGSGIRFQNSVPEWGQNEQNKWAGIAGVAGGGYSNETDLVFYTNSFNAGLNQVTTPSERVRIKATTGNVGIGTVNPTHRLTVNGEIKSKGNVVDTSNWSDYVFADDYKLASLAEVEAHIKEKKHLPGVPSEAEVVANGLDLGKMSAVQMAQIEQLMLHVIELNKQVRAQGEEIRQLKARAVGGDVNLPDGAGWVAE